MAVKKILHAVLTLCVCALLACCAGCTAAPAASSAQPSGSSAAAAASTAADATPVLTGCPVSHSPNSDGAFIEVSVADFNALGFAFGDSVDIAFSNGYTIKSLPYYSGTLVEPGEALLLGSSKLPFIEAGEFLGEDLWVTAGLSDGDTATVTLAEPGAFAGLQEALEMSYTDERADYPSDAAFANFRELKGGNLKPGKFYRGASPVNNKRNRAAYANALIAEAGVQTDFDLADNDGEIEGFLEEDAKAGIDVSHFEGIRGAGNVVAIDLDDAYTSEEYGQKLATGLGELVQHDGPVYIHCTAGKDRTGFVCMVLEALAGASYQQIADDYMATYDNYYQINAADDAERFNTVKEQRLDSMLRHVLGAEKGADPASADLSAGTRSYLKAAGMTDEQIDQLTAYLCA